MSAFPLFVDLKGRKCVVVGGGRIAARKIETLILFNAEIVVISPVITDKLLKLKNAGSLIHFEKGYSEGDLEGAFLAVAATPDRVLNERIADEAAAKNTFVNVADNPERCTFIFPSIVKKNDLVIGITTSGSYPAMSKRIRERIGELLENLDEDVMKLLRECRQRASAEIRNEEIRTKLLNRILEEAVFCKKESNRLQTVERIFCEVLKDEKTDQDRNEGKQACNSPEPLGGK